MKLNIEELAREAGIAMKPAGLGDDGIDTWFADQYLPSGALQRLARLIVERCAVECEEEATRWYASSTGRSAANECADSVRKLLEAE